MNGVNGASRSVAPDLADLTKPHRRRMYGEDYTVTPLLVSKVFGDGQQIIGLCPANTAPNYYVVRIDSSWNLSNWSHAPELLCDHLDEIYEAIHEEDGDAYSCGDACPADCSGGHDEKQRGWPALDTEYGVSWFAIWPKGE